MTSSDNNMPGEVERLRAALKPFADACTITNRDDDETIDDSIAAGKITFGHLRAALAALTQQESRNAE